MDLILEVILKPPHAGEVRYSSLVLQPCWKKESYQILMRVIPRFGLNCQCENPKGIYSVSKTVQTLKVCHKSLGYDMPSAFLTTNNLTCMWTFSEEDKQHTSLSLRLDRPSKAITVGEQQENKVCVFAAQLKKGVQSQYCRHVSCSGTLQEHFMDRHSPVAFS